MTMLTTRFSFGLFLVGKILRFTFFFAFLWLVLNKTKTLSGFDFFQISFFVLTYNFIDSTVQLFFREVYRFKGLVVSGNFDLILVKPLNPLFRSLLGGADMIDLIMLVPLASAIIYLIIRFGNYDLFHVLSYVLLLINAFLIATAFHVSVLALGILTMEVDNMIMVYRDLTRVGTLPIDIYQEPLRSFLTFIIPVGMMMTFPVKSLIGLLSWPLMIVSFLTGGLTLFLSLKFWHFALSKYSSASS